MKRYIVKASFKSLKKLKLAKKRLLQNGISKEDMDDIVGTLSKDKNLSMVESNKSFELFVKFMRFGLFFGLLFNLFSIDTSFFKNFYGWMSSLNFASLTYTMMITGYLFGIIGYYIGKRISEHKIIYTKNNEKDENAFLAVNVNYEIIDSIKKLLNDLKPSRLTVTDLKKEVELGTREQ